MSGEQGGRERRAGFALLTVLFGLALVTTLLAASLGLSSAHVKVAGYEARWQEERALVLGAIELAGVSTAGALVHGAVPGTPEPELFSLGARTVWVLVRDVGGLVDLNTAAEPLLERLLEGLGAEPTPVLAAIRARRRSLTQFRDVEAFGELEDLSPELYETAAPFLTVYSGHRGIAPEVAPTTLLEALGGAVPPELHTPPSGRVFAVSVWVDGLEGRRHDAVIAVTAGDGYAVKVVELGR